MGVGQDFTKFPCCINIKYTSHFRHFFLYSVSIHRAFRGHQGFKIMNILLKGITSNKSTVANVDANSVECNHATVHPTLGEGERFQLAWSLDFSNISQQEILEAAAESFIIKIRRVLAKDSKPQDVDWDNATFDVSDFITVRTSKTEKLVKVLADFSDEQLAALGLTRA